MKTKCGGLVVRRIAFRAWGGATNEHPPYMIYDGFEIDAKTGMCLIDNSSGFPEEMLDWELMQFTGLHDKDSKEIFEGDILEYSNGNNYRLFVAEWKTMGTYSGFGIGERSIPNIKVVGNHFENPELLESK